MKRITALFLAGMLTLSVTACDKKKTDTEPLPEEVTEETVESTEPVYIEAADEDFVDIDFNISIIDDEPPVKMNVADLSGVDFGERLTPCKTESEYRDRYGYTARYDDPEMQAEYERLYEVFCNTPSAGHIENVAFIDDKFYFAVNYDDFCSRHDSSLFSFDPKSGEYKELDRRSGMEYNGSYAGLISCGGRLFFYDRPERMHDDDPENSTVYVLDPKTAEISEFIKVDYSIYWMEDTANGLYVSGSVANAETEENSWRFAYYDPETGLKLDYSEEPKYARFWGKCDGVPVEVSGGIDWSNGEETDEPVTIKTQYYTIKTDFKRVENVLAWKDRLSVLVDERAASAGSEKRLYTYELNTMERTKMNLNGFGGNYVKAGEGFFALVESSDYSAGMNGYYQSQVQIYYFMPKIGTAFRMEKVNAYRTGIVQAGDMMYIISSQKAQQEDPHYSIGMYSNEGRADKLYWFETQEYNVE